MSEIYKAIDKFTGGTLSDVAEVVEDCTDTVAEVGSEAKAIVKEGYEFVCDLFNIWE